MRAWDGWKRAAIGKRRGRYGAGVQQHDLVVVGAGIVGLAVAREWLLRYPHDTVTVLERESAPAQHQSGKISRRCFSGASCQD